MRSLSIVRDDRGIVARLAGQESLVVAEQSGSRAGVPSDREGLSPRNVAERSGIGFAGHGFPNRLEDLLD